MSNQPSYEEVRKLVAVEGGVPKDIEFDGTSWDKRAPQGPPTPMERAVPEWFAPVHNFIRQVVGEEGLVADLCLERALAIVQFNHDRGLAGIDHFDTGSTRMNMVLASIPLGVELYKQVVGALAGPHRDAFEAVVKSAIEKRGVAQ